MLSTIVNVMNKTKFKFIAESPTIAIGAGVVGLGATIVLSSRATLKAQDVVAEHKAAINQTVEDYNLVKDSKNSDGTPKLTEKDFELMQLNVWFKSAVKMAKIYAPSVALAGLSIAAIVYGRNVFQNRLTTLGAAYQVATSSLEAYRKKMGEELGVEKEEVIYHETMKDLAPKNGKKSTKGYQPSVYARFFDEYAPNWTSSAAQNKYFLRATQTYFNDLLNRRGFLFLNEVYSHLGLDETPEGQLMGWIRDKDSYVDFGIFDGKTEASRAFINENEASVLLDFNVDGYILDKI